MGRYAQLVVGPAGSGKVRALVGRFCALLDCYLLGSPRTASSCTRTAEAWAELFTL